MVSGTAERRLMAAYVVRRLVFSLFVLWGAVTIIFVVLRLVPGDPAYIMLGPDADQAQVAALRAQLGLDQSLIQQYATYLANVVRLDFGAVVPAERGLDEPCAATASGHDPAGDRPRCCCRC